MANRQSEQVRVECDEILRDQDLKSILVLVNWQRYGLMRGYSCEIWLPRSQVHSICADPKDCHAMVTPWIAKQKGLL